MAASSVAKALAKLGRLRRRLLLSAFHLLYNQFAWAYEAVSVVVSLGRWREWGECALPFLQGQRILELGHGPGHLLVALRERGCWAVGLDASVQMGRKAWQRLHHGGHPTWLVRGHGQQLPFPQASFDSVVAAFPAPYILAPETVAAVRRVLRPGGQLVIVPQATLTRSGVIARAVDWLYALAGQRSTGNEAPNQIDQVHWLNVLAGAGFAVTVHRVLLTDSLVWVVVAELESSK